MTVLRQCRPPAGCTGHRKIPVRTVRLPARPVHPDQAGSRKDGAAGGATKTAFTRWSCAPARSTARGRKRPRRPAPSTWAAAGWWSGRAPTMCRWSTSRTWWTRCCWRPSRSLPNGAIFQLVDPEGIRQKEYVEWVRRSGRPVRASYVPGWFLKGAALGIMALGKMLRRPAPLTPVPGRVHHAVVALRLHRRPYPARLGAALHVLRRSRHDISAG